MLLLAEERDRPGVGPVVAREDLHERRLAGAVVADQPEHLALAQVQADVAQRRHGAEALGQVLDAQHVVGRAVGLHGGRARRRSCGLPADARDDVAERPSRAGSRCR